MLYLTRRRWVGGSQMGRFSHKRWTAPFYCNCLWHEHWAWLNIININMTINIYICITITHRNWKHWTCLMAILIFACRGMKSVAVTVAARGSHRAVLLVPLAEFKPPASKWNRWVYIYNYIHSLYHYISFIIQHISLLSLRFSSFFTFLGELLTLVPPSSKVLNPRIIDASTFAEIPPAPNRWPGTGGGPRDHPSSAVPGNLCQRILAIKHDKATAGKTMPCLPSPSHHYRWYMVV